MSLVDCGGPDARGTSVAGTFEWRDPWDPWRVGRETGPVYADAAAGCGSGRLGLAHRGDSGASQGTCPRSVSAGAAPVTSGPHSGLFAAVSAQLGCAQGPEARPSFFVKTSRACAQHPLTMGPGDCEASPLPPGPLGWVSPCHLGQGCGWGTDTAQGIPTLGCRGRGPSRPWVPSSCSVSFLLPLLAPMERRGEGRLWPPSILSSSHAPAVRGGLPYL